jgi:hypothetical protein
VRAVAVAIALVLLAGCAKRASPASPLVSGSAARPAYAGPMYVPFSIDQEAPVVNRSGAAGKALECRYPPYAGGSGVYDDGLLEVKPSYARALVNFFADGGSGRLPTRGYRVERTDGNRVLLSWDVDGYTKIAIIMKAGTWDYLGHHGWGVETWAECDPAEFPAATTDGLGFGVWLDRHGGRVPTARVQSYPRDEWCGFSGVAYLQVGPNARARFYVRDAGGMLTKYLLVPYDGAATLPADATDSGWHRDGRELWLVPRGESVYLVSQTNPSDVERWPLESPGYACD